MATPLETAERRRAKLMSRLVVANREGRTVEAASLQAALRAIDAETERLRTPLSGIAVQSPANKQAFLEANPPAAQRLGVAPAAQGAFTITGAGLREPVSPATRVNEQTGEPLPLTIPPGPATTAPAGATGAPALPTGAPAPAPFDPAAFLQAAEDTPELAAFKAALDAPAPVFQKIGFNPAEQIALGFLAGLRGTEAIQPIIERRRQDARDAYALARDARAEKLGGLFQSAQAAEQARGRRFSQAVQLKQLEFEGRRVATTEQTAAATAAFRRAQAARAGAGQILPANVTSDFGAAINAANRARKFLADFRAAGKPGGPLVTLGGNVAFTEAQQRVRADLQATTNEIKRDLLGAARTLPELADVSGFLGSFGDRDSTIEISMETITKQTISRTRAQLAALKSTGWDTSGIEAQLINSGYSGLDVAAPLIPTPPGLTFDPTFSLMEEEGGLEEGMQ